MCRMMAVDRTANAVKHIDHVVVTPTQLNPLCFRHDDHCLDPHSGQIPNNRQHNNLHSVQSSKGAS